MIKNEEFRYFFDNAPIGMSIVTKDGQLVAANKQALALFGCDSTAELLEKPVEGYYYTPQDRRALLGIIRKNIAEDQQLVKNLEIQYRRKDGSSFWGSVSALLFNKDTEEQVILVTEDITQRKNQETELFASEARYRSLFMDSKDAIYIASKEGAMIAFNEAMVNLHGYSPEELRNLNVSDLYYYPSDRAKFQQEITQKGYVKDYAIKTRGKSGGALDCLLTASPWKNIDGETLGYQGIVRDITEEKRAQEELKLRATLLDSVSDMVFLYEMNGTLVFVNNAVCDLLGYSKGKLSLMNISQIVHHSRRSYIENKINIIRKAGTAIFKTIYVRKDGSSVPVEVNARLIESGGQEFILSVVRDITARKEIEAKFSSYQQQLQSLSSQLSLTEARERRRIALEIHDSIGQTLALCGIEVNKLEDLDTTEKRSNKIKEIRQMISHIINETRTLTFNLSSPLLYEIGLEAALEQLTEQISKQHGINCRFLSDGLETIIGEDVRVLLFQTIRELLLNVVKHAKASNTTVQCYRDGNYLVISVEDDGVGFDIDDTLLGANLHNNTPGIGLFSIRERLRYLGGEIDVRSNPGKGTLVTLSAPVAKIQMEIKDKI